MFEGYEPTVSISPGKVKGPFIGLMLAEGFQGLGFRILGLGAMLQRGPKEFGVL